MNEEITYQDVLNARKMAQNCHFEQTRKFGDDKGKRYFDTHLVRVADRGDTNLRRAAGFLHDILEDFKFTGCTEDHLVNDSIPRSVIDVVLILTKKYGESYFDFIMRIIRSGNIDAIIVKINDINDNMMSLEEGQLKDKYRLAKYILINAILDS